MKSSPRHAMNADSSAKTTGANARIARPARTSSETSGEPSPYAPSLLEECAANPRLQAFSSAIGAAGLENLLGGDGPLTIFAPTDRAFSRMPDDERVALLGDSTRLADVLRHHVVAGRVKAPRQTRPTTVAPEFGDALEITATDRGFRVDDARIVKPNIRASNGVIHAIDRVLGLGAE